jgi:hypothetical protein
MAAAANKGEARMPLKRKVSNDWVMLFVLVEIANAEWHLRSCSIAESCRYVCALAYLQGRKPQKKPAQQLLSGVPHLAAGISRGWLISGITLKPWSRWR